MSEASEPVKEIENQRVNSASGSSTSSRCCATRPDIREQAYLTV